jgi:hypothetical protein
MLPTSPGQHATISSAGRAGILREEQTVDQSRDWKSQADEWLDQPSGERPAWPEAPSLDDAEPGGPLPRCTFCEHEAVVSIVWNAAPLPGDDVCVVHAELAMMEDQGRGALRIIR